MADNTNQNQVEAPINNLIERNPFNVKYIKAEARRALKALKLQLKKDMKFEQIMAEIEEKKRELKREVARNVGEIVDLKKGDLQKTLEETVTKVFDQLAQQEVLDADLLNSEIYGDTEFHIDFELIELFKKVRSNKESKNSAFATVPPHITVDQLTSSFVYGESINTFVVTQDGGRYSKVLGVVSREVLAQEESHISVGDSSRFLPITEPLPVETVHSLMFQHKLACYPLLDLENKLVDIISFQEMELIIKKRTKKSIQAIDTNRKLHEALPEVSLSQKPSLVEKQKESDTIN